MIKLDQVLYAPEDGKSIEVGSLNMTDKVLVSVQWLHGFAHEVAAKEREACAKAAEGFTDGRDDRKWVPGSLYDTLRRETAAFIRSRGRS